MKNKGNGFIVLIIVLAIISFVIYNGSSDKKEITVDDFVDYCDSIPKAQHIFLGEHICLCADSTSFTLDQYKIGDYGCDT